MRRRLGRCRGLARQQLSFNYLGRFAAAGDGEWGLADDDVRLDVDAGELPLSHGLSLDALTAEGTDGARLVAHWRWAPALLGEAEVSDLAAGFFGALEALVKHASQAGAGGRSPSDLPLVALTQGELEELERQYPQLEDVLPLSPLQEGLLFHALYDARGPDVYTVQLDLELLGELDVVRLEASLAAVVERHASLRAGVLAGRAERCGSGDRGAGAAAVAADGSVGACGGGAGGRRRAGCGSRARRAL